MNLGKKLKYLRNKQNLTQKELANKIGVRRATIAGYETKGKEPSYSTLKKLARALNCSIDFLLDNTDQETNISNDNLHYLTKILQRDDLKKLLKLTQNLEPSSVNRIIDIIGIIEEEINERTNSSKNDE